MDKLAITIILYLFIAPLDTTADLDEHNRNRMKLLAMEMQQSLGGKLQLTDKEKLVNNILMDMKEKGDTFNNSQYFNLSKDYLAYKDEINKSKLYQLIRKMPKGALLHAHASLMLGADHLLELTYEDHLYICLTDEDLKFYFSETKPRRPCPVEWVLLSDLRNTTLNVSQLDANLRKYLTLYAKDHIGFETNVNVIWDKFRKIIGTISSLTSYRPVREKAFYQSLQNCYDDGIMYVEIRTDLYEIYELNGTKLDRMCMAAMYNNVAQQFKQSNPDFVGIKLIYTRGRSSNLEQIRDGLNMSRRLKQELPDMFAGFDLVGQEDLGKPLKDFLPALIEAKDEINFYFHAGETNWYGSAIDENLIDAILLGTKRIGHGYALSKHPELISIVAEKGIALEVNVISNAVLSLVQDLRNHPLATYLALGLPVVLSSDDPGVWDAEPLTDDFYVAFAAVASKHADLRMLKQLALNSIRYSALDDKRKTSLFRAFDKKWNEFIDDVILNNR